MLHSATQAGLEGDGDISENEFKDIIHSKTGEQLNAKLTLGDFICKSLSNDPDPRSRTAINRIRRQQQWINDELTNRKKKERQARGEPEPEPVAIQLQTLRIRGGVKGLKNG